MVKFPKPEMFDVLDDGEDIVSNEITDHGRWSVTHEIVFKKDGKLYRTYYSVGATESQDEAPWEYDDEVECTEVVAQEKTITVYVPKEEA